MAVTEERVKARFREKFKTVALSNKTLDALAAKVAPIIPDDAEDGAIDTQLDFLNGLHPDGAFLVIQKADDKAVSDKKKQEQSNNSPVTPPATTPEKKPEEEMPAWFKPFAQKLEAVEKKEQLQTKQQIAESLLADVPKGYRTLALATMPDNPEEHAAWAEGVKQQAIADRQAEANSNRGPGMPPIPPKPNGNKEAPKEEVEARAKRLMNI